MPRKLEYARDIGGAWDVKVSRASIMKEELTEALRWEEMPLL